MQNLKLLLQQSLLLNSGGFIKRQNFVLTYCLQVFPRAMLHIHVNEHSDLLAQLLMQLFPMKKDPSLMSETLIRKKLFIMKLNTQSDGPIQPTSF